MDYFRALTAMSKGTPETDIPWDRKEVQPDELPKGKTLKDCLLDESCYVESPNDEGIPHAWKVKGENKWRGVLMQYCSVTDDQTFDNIDDCIKWYVETHNETGGWYDLDESDNSLRED